MDFRIANTFTDALARLPSVEQKAVKVSILDLQLDPSAPGLQMHRVENARDPNFWSARVGRDLRLILHKTASNILVAYVDRHDAAYAWAQRRQISPHPLTGGMQIVVLPEFVATNAVLGVGPRAKPRANSVSERRPFLRLSSDELLSVGTPTDWIDRISRATEEEFFEWSDLLPPEAANLLFDYCIEGKLTPAPTVVVAQAFEAPSAQAQFRRAETPADLNAVLNHRWSSDPGSWRRRFAKYLVSPHRRGGRPLTLNSARSYCSYISGINRALDIDLASITLNRSDLARLESGLRHAQDRIGRTDKIIGDWISGLRAFADFRSEADENDSSS